MGGLSAALGALRAGCTVTVLERAARVKSVTGAVSYDHRRRLCGKVEWPAAVFAHSPSFRHRSVFTHLGHHRDHANSSAPRRAFHGVRTYFKPCADILSSSST